MSISIEQGHNRAGAVSYRIVATIDRAALPRLREALRVIRPDSISVSTVLSWTDGGRTGFYRGTRYRLDRELARVEITCEQKQVAWITNAIERAGATGPETDAIAAQ